jgi:hypothetical protein
MLKKKDPSLLVFEADQVLKRVEKMGDLFEPVLKLKQKLPKLEVGASPSTSPRSGSTGAAGDARRPVRTGLQISAQAGSRKKTAKPGGKKATAGKKTRKI